jgi:hypothetical protein
LNKVLFNLGSKVLMMMMMMIFFLEETSNLISRRLVAETQNCKKRRDGTGCQFHGPMSTEPQAVKITAVREMSNLSQNRVTAVSSNLGTCGDRAS